MNENQKKQTKLTKEEREELDDGQALYEMQKTKGFEVLKKWLENMAFHSWVDPREVESKEAWEWRELNAFHAANNASELLDSINKAVSRAQFLEKKRRGEIKTQRMRI